MRHLILAAALSFASAAYAQPDKTWTPAPVPSVSGGSTIQPAARARGSVSDDNSTPFSSTPSGSVAAGGATSANDYNGAGTPNLSK